MPGFTPLTSVGTFRPKTGISVIVAFSSEPSWMASIIFLVSAMLIL